jgi:predicted DNA-binding ribbon-helix-helix protein
MKSPNIKHSVAIAGRKTSVSLEDVFWDSLREIGKVRNETLEGLVNKINAGRQLPNLSSAIRVFVLDYYRNRQEAAPTSEAGEPKVGA